MAKAKPTTTPKSDQQLGSLIAAVLKHPDLPTDLYNTIADGVTELQNVSSINNTPELFEAVVNLLPKRPAEPKAAEEDDTQPDPDDEPDLRLPMSEFRQLQQVWYAIGEISEMADAPENDGGGLACLKIVNDQGLGAIMAKLQAQIDLRAKGGAA